MKNKSIDIQKPFFRREERLSQNITVNEECVYKKRFLIYNFQSQFNTCR